MNELHRRINKVINTSAFEASLEESGIDVIEFQTTWHKLSGGSFGRLPQNYQEAIIAGERELRGTGSAELVFA
jgi:hypothetical protein